MHLEIEAVSSTVEKYLTTPTFSYFHPMKDKVFADLMSTLTSWHLQQCLEYSRIVSSITWDDFGHSTLEKTPFIPTRIFKNLLLRSVPQDQIVKTMRSSGTSSGLQSAIELDRLTARLQTRALTNIMAVLLGTGRQPMLVIDSADSVGSRAAFSARGAAIRGFSMFGRHIEFALDEDLNLREGVVERFIETHKDVQILIFGFTSLIWGFLKLLDESGSRFSLKKSIVLHGGGWKKLQDLAVSVEEFELAVKSRLGVSEVVNYYGLVEQTGSIFLGCKNGALHSSAFSEVVIRDPYSFQPVPHGQEGVVQLLSVLPVSYPGHSILTEDLGVVLGDDDCPCGRPGRYFRVIGRMTMAEVRGCSDTIGSGLIT